MQRIIQSKLYDDLPNEVPYNLNIELEYYEVSREGNFSYLKASRMTGILKRIFVSSCLPATSRNLVSGIDVHW